MKIVRSILLLTAVFLLTACSASVEWARSHGQALNQSSADFADETETRSHTLTVRESMQTIIFDLEATVSQGAVTFRLLNPDGTPLWEQEVTPDGQLTTSKRYTPTAGEWTLEVMLLDASGEYELVWRAR
jgi:outer membrane biogenesis lipoprotein LolB